MASGITTFSAEKLDRKTKAKINININGAIV